MSFAEWVGPALLCGGVMLLVLAWVLRLWRRAGRFSKLNRWQVVGLMAVRQVDRLLPSRESVVIAAIMGCGFVARTCGFATVWLLGLWFYASTLPVVTEAYEGFGDAMMLVMFASFGLVLAPMAGLVFMAIVADFAYRRMERNRHRG